MILATSPSKENSASRRYRDNEVDVKDVPANER